MDGIDQLKTLTVEGLASAMDIQVWRIRQMIEQGKAPPFFKVGRSYRFPLVGVLRWMEEQTGERKEE